MLDELLAVPGVDERYRRGSSFGFLALHGGLEQGTAEIAEEAAHASGASFYAVVQPPGFHWHVPSHRYEPECSERLRSFCAAVDIVCSVHGFGGLRHADDRWTTALLGGSNRELAAELRRALRTALPGYRWIDDLDEIPRRLRGLHPCNPVNRVAGGGVQIELPPRIRRRGADYETLVRVLAAVAADGPRRCSGGGPLAPA